MRHPINSRNKSSSAKTMEDKLIPLRKFVVPGVYSAAYLSQLVQRKKLKAKKIGRNFYTSEVWLKEYIEKHARDGKQVEFVKNFLPGNVYLKEQNNQSRNVNRIININIARIINSLLLKQIAAKFGIKLYPPISYI